MYWKSKSVGSKWLHFSFTNYIKQLEGEYNMGYSTDFAGVLTFKNVLNAPQIARLSDVLGADIRDLPEDVTKFFKEAHFEDYHIDLEFTSEFDGLKWNGCEKTHGMVQAINGIILYMKHLYPDFGLEGEMVAQGERIKDRWKIKMISNDALKFPIDMDMSKYVECPECGHEFIPGEDE